MIIKNFHPAATCSKISILSFITLCLVFCAPASAFALDLAPYQTEYFSKAKSFDIKTVRTLEKKGEQYQVKQQATAMVMTVSETSLFSLLDNGNFAPQTYIYNRKILGNNRTYQNNFSEKDKTATFEDDGELVKTVSLKSDVYDLLSYQEKMRIDLMAHSGKLVNSSYTLMDKERLRTYEFRSLGHKWLKTPVGWLRTEKIERVRSGNKKQTRIWLARDFGYVIVKVYHQEESEPDYKLVITKGIYNNAPIVGSQTKPTKQ